MAPLGAAILAGQVHLPRHPASSLPGSGTVWVVMAVGQRRVCGPAWRAFDRDPQTGPVQAAQAVDNVRALARRPVQALAHG